MSNQTEALTFFELYALGNVLPDDIDDYIDAWHERFKDGIAKPGTPPLHEYLGLTSDEYAVWLGDASALPYILKSRNENCNLECLVREHVSEMQAAARASDKTALAVLRKWLANRSECE